jgi:HTH-type transcriptional regulator/antitoxin HigA
VPESRRPAEAFRPGEYIQDELDARGWSQTDLAVIMGRPVSVINELISGKRGITAETALGLEAALDLDAQYWLNLEAAYRLWRARAPEREAVARRAKLFGIAPINHMVKRGWLEGSDSIDVLETQVKTFFHTSGLDEVPDVPAAARKSTAYHEAPTLAQRAWLYRAWNLAGQLPAEPFSRGALKEAIEHLKTLTAAPQEVRRVPRIVAAAGVRFLVIQPLPGSKIDGACCWLDERQERHPVVVLSLRFDRLDNFWFVLMHELMHVLNGDTSVDPDLADASDAERLPAFEREANRRASETLIPAGKLESFIARTAPAYSAARILGFANLNHVHPAIVVGQLQHRGEIGWGSFRKFLVSVREIVTASALTDGWGGTLPA